MIKIIDSSFCFEDDRGIVKGIIDFGEWKEINYISSARNTIRGNHYHRLTTEVFIIIEGKIQVELQLVKNNTLIGNVQEVIVKKGDVFLIEPSINHTFKMLEDSVWFNLLSRPFNRELPDLLSAEQKQ